MSSSKPFCKVCYDAGKTEREYTSHFVKSKPGNDGKVTCPYLLSLECTYCKKKEGHTARYCPILAQKKTAQVAENKRPVVDQDGWEVKKGQAAKQVQLQQKQAQASKQARAPEQAQTQKKKSTFSVLSDLIAKEEKREAEVETQRVQYDAEFPWVQAQSNVQLPEKQVPEKPIAKIQQSWSAIAKKAPNVQLQQAQLQAKQQAQAAQQQAQAAQQAKQREDSDTEDDDEEPVRSWGWSGDWNDCPY